MKNDKNDSKFMCFSLVDSDPDVIIPDYKENITSNSGTFVKWGPNNTYPNDLRSLTKESVTASSVINGISEYFKGLEYTFNLSGNITVDRVNHDGDDIYDLIDACLRDQIIFGGFAIQVIYNKLGKIAELYNIPMDFLRMNEDRDKFFFSKKWAKYSSKSIEYPKFDRDRTDTLVPSEVYHMTNAGRNQVYPISNFTPAVYDMYSEAMGGKYIAKQLDGGLSSRFIVSLPNAQNLTDEQKQDIEDGIKNKFCGVNNAGSAMLFFNAGDQGLEVEKIDSDNSHEVFNSISDEASLRIYKCMHATPALFGDPSKSSGFNSNEYEEALKVFKKMTLKPLARVIERGFNIVLGDNSVKITVN